MYTRLKNIKQIKCPSDVPVGPHMAVLIYKTESVWVPGDERSKTCPGHGYPEHTESYPTFEHWVTTDKDTLLAFVQEVELVYKKSFVVLSVTGQASIKHQISIDL
jgi:hypothetical protein